MFWPQAIARSRKERVFGNRRAVSWGPGSATTLFGQVAFCFLWRPDQGEVLERL